MKTKLPLLLAILLPLALHAATDLSTALQKGLFEEEANQNLPAAIQAYQSLLAASDDQRKLAATALFRLGECYRKLGQTNDAIAQYQRLIRDFTDQTTLATLSRQNLVGLGARTSEVPPPASNPAERTDPAIRAEALRAEVLLKQLSALTRGDLRRVLPTAAPDPLLNTLLEQLADGERRLASARTSFADDHPTVKATRDGLKVVQEQIEERIGGIMQGLAIKAASLKQQAGEPAGGSTGSVAVIDDEEPEIRRIQAIIKDSPDLINAPNVEVTKVRSGELMLPRNGTLLHKAASLGQLRVVTFLLDHGADIGARDQSLSQNTPLHWAANNGHRAMVELLLSRKADPNAILIPDGSTPLLLATRKSFRSVCEALLARGANPNLPNRYGSTPLQEAAGSGDESILRLLLAKGAEVNRKSNSGTTPLHRTGSTNIVRLLLDCGAEVNAQDEEGRSPLFGAAERDQRDLLQFLLAQKADTKLANKSGWTPLHAAANAGAASVIAPLIQNGADPNQRDGSKRVPLEFAFQKTSGSKPSFANYPDTLKALLAGGADPNQVVDPNVPLLFRAVTEGTQEVVALLLKAGANPNAKTDYASSNRRPGLTALIRALEGGQRSLSLVNLLLEYKADPNLQEDDGNGPLYWAIASGQLSIGEKGPFVETLLKHGANIEGKNKNGITPLAQAAVWGLNEVAAFLLKHKADPNVKAGDGPPLLHVAVGNRNVELMEMLLAAGVNPNATDARGLSALDYAKQNARNLSQGSRNIQSVPGLPSASIPGAPGTPRSAASPVDLADKLRQAGARDWAPRPGQITVTRRSTGATLAVFTKGTNDWNRHSLLEVMGFTFFGSGSSFPFPDLSKLTITRLDPASGGVKEFTVDLPAKLAAEDCKADQWLEWGDLIDIPEGEHKLNERWDGRVSVDIQAVAKCLARKVTITMKGKSKDMQFSGPTQWRNEQGANGIMRYYPEPTFRLRQTVLGSGLLLTSSDTSRVKVKRTDAASGRVQEWTFDLSKEAVTDDDLWLRDGDVIEVPEK